MDLTQHVAKLTHNNEHTLDLIISKGLNISKVSKKDVAPSDHSYVFLECALSVHTNVPFEQLCAQPFLVSHNELVGHFNSKITNIDDY